MSDLKIKISSLFKGFSKLAFEQRLKSLNDVGLITSEDVHFLRQGGTKDIALAENFVENVIGYFQLPLGVATNFNIDGKDVVVPMAVEETSIIAAASKTAKWIRENGTLTTEILGTDIIGQIQFAKVQDFENFEKQILAQKRYLIDIANSEVAFGLVQRGGGVKDITIRKLLRDDGLNMGVVHVYMDPCDAMGANVMNQVCEFLKEPLQNFTNEKVNMWRDNHPVHG